MRKARAKSRGNIRGGRHSAAKSGSGRTRSRRGDSQTKTVVIEVSGGVVAEVSNLPPGYDYEIVDHDLEESTTEGWAEEDSL